MKSWTHRLLIATTAAAFLGAVPAMAHMGGKDRGERGQRMEQMQQRMAERQNALKEALQLSPAQEDAWKQYLESFKRPTSTGPRPDREALSAMTTPQRLAHMQSRMAERDAHMKRVADATLAFYNGLTPEQQKVFDEKSRLGAMHHGMPRGHRGHDGRQGGQG